MKFVLVVNPQSSSLLDSSTAEQQGSVTSHQAVTSLCMSQLQFEVHSLKCDDMNISSARKSRENFSSVSYRLCFFRCSLWKETSGGAAVHVVLRPSREAVLVEITHASITQLLFTRFSSKFSNVHLENDHPFRSCYWHGGSRPYNLRTIRIARNKMKTIFRETCIYC